MTIVDRRFFPPHAAPFEVTIPHQQRAVLLAASLDSFSADDPKRLEIIDDAPAWSIIVSRTGRRHGYQPPPLRPLCLLAASPAPRTSLVGVGASRPEEATVPTQNSRCVPFYHSVLFLLFRGMVLFQQL